MTYILIEGYMCERCGYRWGSRNGTGFRNAKDPNNCPNCKSPYWNKPCKRKITVARQSTQSNTQDENVLPSDRDMLPCTNAP